MMIILYSWNTVREFSSSTGLTVCSIYPACTRTIHCDGFWWYLFAGRGSPHQGEGGQEAQRGETGAQEGGNAEGEYLVPPPHLFSNAHFLVHCWRCSRQGGPGQEVDHCRHCHCKVFLLNKAYNTPHHFTIFILSLKCYCGTLTDVSSYCTFCNVVFLVFQSTQSDVQRGNNTLSSLLLFLISSNSH